MSCTDDPFELYFALFRALWLLFTPFFLCYSRSSFNRQFARSLVPGGFTIVGMWNELYG